MLKTLSAPLDGWLKPSLLRLDFVAFCSFSWDGTGQCRAFVQSFSPLSRSTCRGALKEAGSDITALG